MTLFFHEIFEQSRKQAKLSVAKLATQSGVPANTIKGWLKRNSVPRNSDQIVYIASALEVDEVTANRLLHSANHPPISQLMEETKEKLRQASQAGDVLQVAQYEKLQQTLRQWLQRPAAPERFPSISKEFIGRENELVYFGKELRARRYVVIAGQVGVGKTWLATRLALKNNSTEGIFWHECYEDHDQARVIMHMAEFLAWRGEPQFWNLLHERMERGELPDASLLNSILALMSELQVILCFKNFHHIAENPKQKELVDKLIKTARTQNIRIIMTARQKIVLERGVQFNELRGLSKSDARIYLNTQISPQRLPVMSEPLFDQLYQSTEGNVQLLALAVQVLKKDVDPQNLLKQLVSEEEIEQFLVDEVDRTLADHERAIMESISVFLEHPATGQAIEEVSEGDRIRHTLRSLTMRYLIQKTFDEEDRGATYRQMPILREFYYTYLSKAERRALHQRAATYYHYDEIDHLRAAQHYYHGEQHATAARVATQNTLEHIYQGLSEKLRQLLINLTEQQLPPLQQAQIYLSLGQIYDFQEEATEAEQVYMQALELLNELPSAEDIVTLQTRVYRGLAIVLRTRDVEKATHWIEEGLRVVAHDRPLDEADLLIQSGIIRRRKRNDEAVYQAFDQALQLLDMMPTTPLSRNRVDGLRFLAQNNQAIYFFHKNLIEESLTWLEKAYATAQKLNSYKQLSVNINLAALYQISGRWDEAKPQYEEAIAQAEKLGKVLEQSRIYGNAGAFYKQLGEHDQAEGYLLLALELGRDANQQDTVINAQVHLAHVYLRQDKLSEMASLLEEAEVLAAQANIRYQMPMIYRLQAERLTLFEDWQNAHQLAQESVSLAEQLGVEDDSGPALRILAITLHGLGQYEGASQNFAQSLELLKDNPYETALTQAEWGRCLLGQGDTEQGQPMCQEASDMLVKLGAVYDVHKYGID